jgi:hypothetical protein
MTDEFQAEPPRPRPAPSEPAPLEDNPFYQKPGPANTWLWILGTLALVGALFFVCGAGFWLLTAPAPALTPKPAYTAPVTIKEVQE